MKQPTKTERKIERVIWLWHHFKGIRWDGEEIDHFIRWLEETGEMYLIS